MKRIDERASVTDYLKASLHTIDGLTWVFVCLASALCLLDVTAGLNVIPLRETKDFGKAVVLLLFTPLITFLMLVWLRQLPLGRNSVSSLIRSAMCFASFLAINF